MSNCYKHILVPLDASELAELALIDAFSIARLCQAEVTLLQVLTPIEQVLATDMGYTVYIDQQWENQRVQALEYLNNVCKKMSCEGIKIHIAVEMGPAAEKIVDYYYN